MKRIAFRCRWLSVVIVSMVAGACGASDEPVRPPPARPQVRTPGMKAQPVVAGLGAIEGADQHKPSKPESETLGDGCELLAHTPSNAWFVVHVPSLARARDSWSQTAIRRLLERPEWHELMPDLQHWLDQAASFAPWLGDLRDVMSSMHGELALALVDVDVDHLTASSALPFTLLLQADVGEQSAAITQLLDMAFATLQFGKSKPAATGRWLASRSDMRFEAVIEKGRLTAIACPPDAPKDRIARYTTLPVEKSFLVNDMCRDVLRDTARTTFAEVFLQFDALWRLARTRAPGDVAQFLTLSGLDRLSGLSVLVGGSGDAIAESVQLHSPGGKDLLSRILADHSIATRLAKWIPSNARAGGLAAFSLQRAFDEVQALLRPDERRDLEAWRRDAERQYAVDLRADVIDNVGPSFAYASSGNLAGLAIGGSFSWMMAAEVKDAKRAAKAIEQALKLSGMASAVTQQKIASYDVTVLKLPPLPFASGSALQLKPAWCLLDGCLLVADDMATLQESLQAGAAVESTPPAALQEALKLAGDGAWSVSFSEAREELSNLFAPLVALHMPEMWTRVKPMLEAADLPSTMMFAKRHENGLRFEARSATGVMLSAAGLGGTAIAASIAIPNLMSARIEANELVAVQTLKRIAAAEDKMHSARSLDADRDGRPEYGRLVDLVKKPAGNGLAQGGAAPLADDKMTMPQEGFAEKSGYVFWVGFPEPEQPARGSRKQVASGNAADFAETQFIAYAWPKSRGQTGATIYAIDAAGQLYYSDNNAPGQSYSGYSRVPRGDAALPIRDPDRALSNSVLHRGNDGALWLLKD